MAPRVLLVEEKLAPAEPRGALFALDPALVAELRLAAQGLAFLRSDLTLSGWDDEHGPLILARDRLSDAGRVGRTLGAVANASSRGR